MVENNSVKKNHKRRWRRRWDDGGREVEGMRGGEEKDSVEGRGGEVGGGNIH